MREANAFDPLSRHIIGLAIEVHPALGPGLLESAYEQCLCHELRTNNINFRSQVPIPIIYKWLNLDCDYRLDLMVENSIVVEIKSVDRPISIHSAKILT